VTATAAAVAAREIWLTGRIGSWSLFFCFTTLWCCGGGRPARLGDDDGGRWRRGTGEDPRPPGVVAAEGG